jgi:TetR/AcrR family transcriptional regulator, transcriptional repressor for nem operon
MSKAALTRSHIIQQAAGVFNRLGYAGTSMADLMAATGLKKGGIYNHFASKDDLAFAAFDYLFDWMQQRYSEALQGRLSARDRLIAVVETAYASHEDPLLQGGCPLLNTAIESDDTHAGLRQRVRVAMDRWRTMVAKIVRYGQKNDELLASLDPDEVATVLIATMEGSVMMSKLYGDRTHLIHARNHLLRYIDTLCETA